MKVIDDHGDVKKVFSPFNISKNEQRTHRTCLCVLCIVACFCISGCWKHFTRDDFIGAYNADFSFATAKLTLRADGTFVQEVWVKSPAKHRIVTGTWKYTAGNDYIVFDDHYLYISDPDESHPIFEHSPRNMIAIPPVRYQFGQIQIDGDDIPWGRTPIETPYTKQ